MRATASIVLTCPAPTPPPGAPDARPRVALVPYTQSLVPTYHAWLENEALREATASERLTLEEEVAMCDAWAVDEDKATFIIVVKEEGTTKRWTPVGDVNLFFNDPDGDRTVAEIEVMVAVPSARRGGAASSAVALMLSWAAATVGLKKAVAKIGLDNAPSLALFDRLGFATCGGSAVFREEHKAIEVGSEAGAQLMARVRGWRAVPVADFKAECGDWE